MPYPEGHKIKVRGKIIESAAKAFRTNGIRDISVPVIMKGAGLTHGGFSSHFENKDQLITESCKYAVDDTIAILRQVAEETKSESKIHAVIDYYLSPTHRDNTEFGCIIPTLSGENPQLSQDVRHVFTLQLQRIIDFITQLANVNKSTASALFSLMIGTIVLARSVSDSNMSDNILTSGRQHAKDVLHTLKWEINHE